MFYSRIQAEIFQDRSQSGNMPLHISTQGNEPIIAKLTQQTLGILDGNPEDAALFSTCFDQTHEDSKGPTKSSSHDKCQGNLELFLWSC